ncbi:MAG: hypothetical protein IPK99_12525 [Flavobacteriales bacterium]|nr:hypothetical protein [Flavobacteriales bacterium]
MAGSNIGLRLVPVDVDPHAYLTARAVDPQVIPFLSEFDEDPEWTDPETGVDFNVPGFAIILPLNRDCVCDDIKYFCTKAGASFNLMGYAFGGEANRVESRKPCDFGPGFEATLEIGEAGVGGDAFPNEFRNWFQLVHASCAFDGSNDGDFLGSATWNNRDAGWSSASHWPVQVYEDYGVGFPLRAVHHDEPDPGSELYDPLETLPFESADGTEASEADLTDGELALADDGIASFGVNFHYQGDQTTLSGPFSGLPHPAYKFAQSYTFRMDREGRLPCPNGTLRVSEGCLIEGLRRIEYVQPAPSFPGKYQVGVEATALFDPADINFPPGASSPLPYVWVDFCERLPTEEGLEVVGLVAEGISIDPVDPQILGEDDDIFKIVAFSIPVNPLSLEVEVERLARSGKPRHTLMFRAARDRERCGDPHACDGHVRMNTRRTLFAPRMRTAGNSFPSTAWFELNRNQGIAGIATAEVVSGGCCTTPVCWWRTSAKRMSRTPGGVAISTPGWEYVAGTAQLTWIDANGNARMFGTLAPGACWTPNRSPIRGRGARVRPRNWVGC